MKQYIINNVLNKHIVTLVIGDTELNIISILNEFPNHPNLIEINSGSRHLINLNNVSFVKVV